MKAKGILGAVFFAAIIFAAGYRFGAKHSIKGQDFGAGTMNGSNVPRLPPIQSQPATGEVAAADAPASQEKFSLVQIEKQLCGMSKRDRRKQRDLEKIIEAIAPGDFAQALAALERNPLKAVRDELRFRILSRWSEIDPTAA